MSKTHVSEFITNIREKTFTLFDATYINPKTEKKEIIFQDFSVEDNNSNITVIFGDNASGKSLLVRLFDSIYRKHDDKISIRISSMANRTVGGVEGAMIFGDQREDSTGKVSIRVIALGLNTMIKEDKPSVFIADEPEIGLSPNYSRSLGEYFVNTMAKMDEEKSSLIIVTHNPELVKSIVDSAEHKINFIGVNTKENINEWTNNRKDHSIEDLLMLPEIGNSKWKGISKHLS